MHLFSTELMKEFGTTAHNISRKERIPLYSMYKYRDGILTPQLQNARKIARHLHMSLDLLEFKGEHKDLPNP